MDIKKQLNEAVRLLKTIIEIPSISREEDGVATFIFNYIKDKELPVERIGNNIIMLDSKRYKSTPTVLLNSHIDTVKPVSTWTLDPYKATVKDDRIYGLGSNDAGASLITLLLTAIDLFDKESYNIAFCASAEEEISGDNGITKVIKKYGDFDLAIVGEPTEMQPAVAEKGLMVLDCKGVGVAGHAARKEGVNAIYGVLKDLNWFKEYRFEQVSDFLGEVNMNVTQINSGTQHNVVPDLCEYVVDVRGNGCYTNQELLAIIQKSIKSEATPRSIRLNSSSLDISHPIYNRFLELGLKPFGSPTLSDQALMPFNSVKIGPGFSGRSHAADEYINIKELEQALVGYHKILKGLPLA